MKAVKSNRKLIVILLSIVAVMIIIVAAVAFEYVTNAARAIPGESRILHTMEELDITLENAYRDSEGNIVATEGGAKIIIRCSNTKILRIDFKDPTNANCKVISGGEMIECTPSCNLAANEMFPAHYSLKLQRSDEYDTDKYETIVLENKGSVVTNIEIDNRYTRNNRLIVALIMCGLIVLGCALCVIYNKRIKADKLFLVLALGLVTMYAVLLPANTQVSWDEHIHYSRVAAIAPGTTNAAERKLSRLEETIHYDIAKEAQSSTTLNQLAADKIDKSELFAGEITGNPILNAYNFIAYLPAALMLSLCRMLGIGATVALMLMRLINGILFSIICYYGIKRLKYGKSIFAILALCPISIFQASVITYDWWVTAFLFLGSAYVIRELQDSEAQLEKINYFVMLIAFFLGCGPKAIYFLMMATMLLMGENKYRSKKQYRVSQAIICGMMLVILASFMLPFIIGGPGIGDSRGGDGINATEQVAFVLHNPIKYTVIFGYHFVQYLLPSNLSTYFIGLAYIGIGTAVTNSCGIAIIVMLIIAMMTDRGDEENLLKLKSRFSVIAIFVATVLLISTALYVSFTSVGRLTIQGVQGRYLLPLSVLTLMFLRPQGIKSSYDRNTEQIVLSSITALTTAGIMAAISMSFY